MSNRLLGKSVFVTGADGFIGSHLIEQLVISGANVRALVHYNSWNEIGWLRYLPKNLLDDVELAFGDVRDTETMHRNVKDCDYVFHLASLIAIPYSYGSPRSYVESNIVGTLNILEACK